MALDIEDAKLKAIFQFLKANQKWNRDLQKASYRHALCGAPDRVGRVKSLLFNSANAQAQPKLDLLCEFWRKLEMHKWPRTTPTLESLTAALASFLDKNDRVNLMKHADEPWDRLFQVLHRQKGWGKKTAALFIKATINIHRSRDARLHFLEFAEPVLKEGDRVYLPVDAVIVRVFQQVARGTPNFASINRQLRKLEGFQAEDILIWDDLWFWGFISQRTIGAKRKIEWNPAKFWGLQFSPKAHEREIAGLVRVFIRLLRPKGT